MKSRAWGNNEDATSGHAEVAGRNVIRWNPLTTVVVSADITRHLTSMTSCAGGGNKDATSSVRAGSGLKAAEPSSQSPQTSPVA